MHQDIYDNFVEKLVSNTRALRIGNGLDKIDMGPMVSAKERERYEGILQRAIDPGANDQDFWWFPSKDEEAFPGK